MAVGYSREEWECGHDSSISMLFDLVVRDFFSCIESVAGSISRTPVVFACMRRRVVWSIVIIAPLTWAGKIII